MICQCFDIVLSSFGQSSDKCKIKVSTSNGRLQIIKCLVLSSDINQTIFYFQYNSISVRNENNEFLDSWSSLVWYLGHDR